MRAKTSISTRDGVRALLGGMVLAAALALCVGAWLVRGYTIDSGSMAPGLLGPHLELKCPECQMAFVVGVEIAADEARPAACPNCGAQASREAVESVSGDSVLVDRGAFQFRAPHRYEVVALREPNAASQVCVKRVVGLPGERLAIRHGDIYIDGQVARKSLAEQQALAILVHDESRRSAVEQARRWSPETTTTDWRVSAGEWTSVLSGSDARGTRPMNANEDWLSYRHLIRVGALAEFEESPVLDTQPYNQTRPITDPHPVRDLALSIRLVAEAPGKLRLRASDGRQSFDCELDVIRGECILRSGEQVLQTAAGPAIADGKPHEIWLSLFDRQVMLAIDGVVALTHPIDDAIDNDESLGATPRPFAIASSCVQLRIESLRVMRDVYYVSPADPLSGAGGDAETTLSADEFFVLSDNSRLGLDSRHAAFGPAASFNLLIGKPLVARGQGRNRTGWWGSIQVPAFGQFRYIR